MNASSGRTMTRVPERWSGTWADNRALAQMADDAGLEFLLPIGRWKGYGGEIDYQSATFETMTWATGMLASTSRITVFATVHVPLLNPVAAAKMLVTADHVSGGRIGLNIVVGWNEDEFAMFGVAQRPGEQRYPYAQEWIDVAKKIWSSKDEFDFDGRFLQMKGVQGKPKPLGGDRPLIMNAGMSPVGRAYAIRNCDALFTNAAKASVADVAQRVSELKAEARAQNRDVDLFCDGLVVCRPTQKEAEEYYRFACFDQVDWLAVEGLLAKKGITRANTAREEFEAQCRQYVGGMSGRTLIGDPDTIAGDFADLSRAGLRGMAMNFVNYLDELPYFRDEVLPRLERLGLRQSQKRDALEYASV
jgi:alkanesulfonate monooxygenase SsuD/methylene tetrahydromethanopterin reductase-like flavin-dependent oxidoreductase (luciferase family)